MKLTIKPTFHLSIVRSGAAVFIRNLIKVSAWNKTQLTTVATTGDRCSSFRIAERADALARREGRCRRAIIIFAVQLVAAIAVAMSVPVPARSATCLAIE